MPLVKKAKTLEAAPAVATEAPAAAAPTAATPAPAKKAAPLQPADLDRKSREIQRQGAYQAALQSVGVVQHGGKTFDDYLARVRQAAESELVFINEK